MSKIKFLIEDLQKELLVQGLNPGAIDGLMGPMTYKAVLAFQERGERPIKPATIKKIAPIVSTKDTPPWRLAKALSQLLKQVNEKYPNRSKKVDGTIGDTAHSKRVSDHNPDADGVVKALDITHDPVHGVDCTQIANLIKDDPRVRYVIWNKEIYNASVVNAWRPYNGANAHTVHMHVSLWNNPKRYDSDKPWTI